MWTEKPSKFIQRDIEKLIYKIFGIFLNYENSHKKVCNNCDD